MNRQKQSKSTNQQLDYAQLQSEFFTFDLVDKLVQVHTLKDSPEIRREVVTLLALLCRGHPKNMCKFVMYDNFIVASFYD